MHDKSSYEDAVAEWTLRTRFFARSRINKSTFDLPDATRCPLSSEIDSMCYTAALREVVIDNGNNTKENDVDVSAQRKVSKWVR